MYARIHICYRKKENKNKKTKYIVINSIKIHTIFSILKNKNKNKKTINITQQVKVSRQNKNRFKSTEIPQKHKKYGSGQFTHQKDQTSMLNNVQRVKRLNFVHNIFFSIL